MSFSLLIDVLRSNHKQSWERKDTVVEQAAIQCENVDKQVPYPYYVIEKLPPILNNEWQYENY